MNILPKKRWHVRTKDNIARVRKDQAKAREEEEECLRKKHLAEKEARISELRSRTEHTKANNASINLQSHEEQLKHVNLFADFEEGLAQQTAANKEHCREKLEKAQLYEKQIGLLTFLGQDTNEALKLKSWYELPPKKFQNLLSSEEKDAHVKTQNDPLNLIKKHCTVKNKTNDLKYKIVADKRIEPLKAEQHKVKQKKNKREKKAKNKVVKNKIIKVRDSTDHLKRMRDERLRREALENSREELVVLKANGLIPQKKISVREEIKSVTQQYNSQFNPNLAKQNLQKKFEH